MKSILCFELKRCFGSKRLYLSLLTGIVISLLHIIFGVLPLTQWLSSWQGDFFLTPHSAYGHWIGMDSSTVWPTLLYMLLPFLCAFPFSDTVSWDFNTGYVMQIFVRRKKSTYLFAKALTIFIASAFLTATILFFDFAGTALYLPLVRPEALTNLYGISNRSLMAHLFYHILNNQCSDIACFNFFYQRLKTGTIEIHTRKTIVSKMTDILKAIPTGIIFEVFFLIGNGVTLAIQVIIS